MLPPLCASSTTLTHQSVVNTTHPTCLALFTSPRSPGTHQSPPALPCPALPPPLRLQLLDKAEPTNTNVYVGNLAPELSGEQGGGLSCAGQPELRQNGPGLLTHKAVGWGEGSPYVHMRSYVFICGGCIHMCSYAFRRPLLLLLPWACCRGPAAAGLAPATATLRTAAPNSCGPLLGPSLLLTRTPRTRPPAPPSLQTLRCGGSLAPLAPSRRSSSTARAHTASSGSRCTRTPYAPSSP